MRYNAHYHISRRGTKRLRYGHYFSALLLLVSIAVLLLVGHIPLDTRRLAAVFVVSLFRVTVSYVICLVLAVTVGLLAVARPRIEVLLLPILDVAQSFPSFALLPILVFYFGHNSISVIGILVVAMVWPILFAVISGVKDERRDQAEAAKLFGARGWKHLVYYRIPMLRPALATSSIVSWGQAWDTIVGAEIIAGVAGAGSFLGSLGQQGQTRILLLGILVYLFFIFVINQIFWLPLLHAYTKYQAE